MPLQAFRDWWCGHGVQTKHHKWFYFWYITGIFRCYLNLRQQFRWTLAKIGKKKVLQRIRELGLKLNSNKCTFCQRVVEYLGHKISVAGITSKIDAIMKLPRPTSQAEIRACLEMVGHYRKFIFMHVHCKIW